MTRTATATRTAPIVHRGVYLPDRTVYYYSREGQDADVRVVIGLDGQVQAASVRDWDDDDREISTPLEIHAGESAQAIARRILAPNS